MTLGGFSGALGAVADDEVEPGDVELSPFKAAVKKDRGFVAIPRPELLAFFQQQAITAGIAFSIGLAIGALLNPKTVQSIKR